MSAITAIPSHAPIRRAGDARRLTSVPTGDAVRTTTRITRRGRLTITALVAAAALGAGLGPAVAGTSGEPTRSITVEQGQTLSQIAQVHLPGLATDDAVVAIQAENGLVTPFVHAGQELVIPGR